MFFSFNIMIILSYTLQFILPEHILISSCISKAADDGLSEYERLRLERIARNQARLRQLGFDEPKEKEKKKKPPPKPRQSLSDFGPRRELPGRAKRATFNASELVASTKKERKIAEKKNMDACYTCQKEDGGEYIFVIGYAYHNKLSSCTCYVMQYF